jgi:putative lipoprotein
VELMVKKNRKNKAKITDIERERYHGPLVTQGVSLGYIKLYPWINLPFCSFFFYWALIGETGSRQGVLKVLFLTCIILNVVGMLFAFSKFLINRFKFLTYIMIALLTWTALVWIDFIGMLMFITVGDSNSIDGIYQSPLTPFYVILMLFLFILACGLYAWYYIPKNQGKVWAFNQVKEGNRKKTWWNNFAIAFAGATIIPTLLTGYIQIAFGVLLGILFTLTLPAVMVDAVYAAIYIKKHPDSDGLV